MPSRQGDDESGMRPASSSPVEAESQGMNSDSGNLSPDQEKRRAQNRSAQRAFRIRKLQRVKNLERDLTSLLAEHGGLQDSYEQQEEELEGLRAQIATLQSELEQLRVSAGNNQEYGGYILPEQPDNWDFDAFLASSGPSNEQLRISFGTDTEAEGRNFKTS